MRFVAYLMAGAACLTGPWGAPAMASDPLPPKVRRVALQASLSLRLRLDVREYQSGDEVRPDVELINVGRRSIDLRYMKPWAVVPEIWDESGKARFPNAPAFVLDQIVVPESRRLPPQGGLQLWALPILVDDRPRGSGFVAAPPGVVRAYWYYPGMGAYRLRYRIDLKDCLPGATGTLTSNDVKITIRSNAPGELAE